MLNFPYSPSFISTYLYNTQVLEQNKDIVSKYLSERPASCIITFLYKYDFSKCITMVLTGLLPSVCSAILANLFFFFSGT